MDLHRLGDVTVLNDQAAVPGMGFLPVNAYVLHAAEPMVVDTGLSSPDKNFLEDLGGVIDPLDVRWIYLTHPDRDHTGGIFDLLEAAPVAKVITTFLGAGIMTAERPLPMDRVFLLNPGETLDIGDRKIHAVRPPLFDSPATVGFFDDRSGTLFSSDCFGAPMPSAELAGCDDVRQAPAEAVEFGQLAWASTDSPWVHNVDPDRFARTIQPLRDFRPELVLSSHLPPAPGLIETFADLLMRVPDSEPAVGPNQAALVAMLADWEPASVPAI